MNRLATALRDITEKLMLQGIDREMAWNFAGFHIKGNEWNPNLKASRQDLKPTKKRKRGRSDEGTEQRQQSQQTQE